MKSQTIIGLVLLGITGSAFAGPTAYVINGRKVWKSTDGGATFSTTGDVVGGSGNIVGLGYHGNSGTFYASASGRLYSVANIDSANPSLTEVKNLGGGTISFEFFGDVFRGTRGTEIIEFNIVTNSAIGVINTGNGTGGTPSTAKIGSDYYGMTAGGNVYKFKIGTTGTPESGSNQIGGANVTGLDGMSVAGGSGLNGVYYTAAGYAGPDNFKFGTINTTTGAFTLISTTGVGTLTGSMGMTVIDSPVIPLPSGAAMAIVGLGGLSIVRRRRG